MTSRTDIIKAQESSFVKKAVNILKEGFNLMEIFSFVRDNYKVSISDYKLRKYLGILNLRADNLGNYFPKKIKDVKQ
jgi:hypothetical protein